MTAIRRVTIILALGQPTTELETEQASFRKQAQRELEAKALAERDKAREQFRQASNSPWANAKDAIIADSTAKGDNAYDIKSRFEGELIRAKHCAGLELKESGVGFEATTTISGEFPKAFLPGSGTAGNEKVAVNIVYATSDGATGHGRCTIGDQAANFAEISKVISYAELLKTRNDIQVRLAKGELRPWIVDVPRPAKIGRRPVSVM